MLVRIHCVVVYESLLFALWEDREVVQVVLV